MLKHIKDSAEFNNETAKGKVLVDFFATWCGPCKMLAPIVEKVASEHEDITVLKIDVDEVPDVAAKYGIRSIPTLILFEDGKAVDMKLGYMPEESVLRFAKLK
ncbi:MAG: thioredoxin [Bacilli bacterium]|jgi:thioredoxin 1|nr:thioredoxin [Bacilli bacterium]MCR5514124.1 thioredoxin [Bacilli bacterium]